MTYSQSTINYIPLLTSSPNENFDDLEKLDSYFAGKQVIAMGESTHGTHEFFTMRHRVFRYLVEHHGFNTFFLEADYGNCLRINRYIHGEDDDVIAITNSIGLWPWATQEVADLITWIREYNKLHVAKINFIGCDMQEINTTIKELDRIIVKYDSSLIDSTKYVKLPHDDSVELKDKKTIAAYQLVLENKRSVVNQIDFKGEDEFIYKTLIRHFGQTIEFIRQPKFYSFRDLKMGENMLYHLGKDDNVKAFFWAHNGHILDFYKERKKIHKSSFTAGGVLRHELKEKFYSIAQEFDAGSFNAYYMPDVSKNKSDIENYNLGLVEVEESIVGSIGEHFRDTKDELLFVNLSHFDNDKLKDFRLHNFGATFHPAMKNKNKNFFYGLEHFDAMILIKNSTETKLLKE